jgi:hypothetical protein
MPWRDFAAAVLDAKPILQVPVSPHAKRLAMTKSRKYRLSVFPVDHENVTIEQAKIDVHISTNPDPVLAPQARGPNL